jgi:peptidoglycan/LPS O-acetylase OafA/YrhL
LQLAGISGHRKSLGNTGAVFVQRWPCVAWICRRPDRFPIAIEWPGAELCAYRREVSVDRTERPSPSRNAEIRPLTGVRGVAALAVVAYHFLNNTHTGFRPLQHAYLAVDLFFLLSGLVLALNYGSSVTIGGTWSSYIAFEKKRIARVFPLYIVITFFQTAYDVAKHVVFGISMPVTWNAKAMIANLLMIQAWGISHSVVVPAWSLSTEFAAYLLFPVLVSLTIESKPAVAGAFFIACLGALWYASLGPHDCIECGELLNVIQGDSPHPLMRCLGGFSIGMLAYRLVKHRMIRSLTSNSSVAIFSTLVTIAAFALGWNDFLVYGLLIIVVLVCFADSPAANRMFGNRAIFFLGKISYAIYLVHMLVFPVVYRISSMQALHLGDVGRMVSTLIAFVSVLLLATAAHYLIEVPGSRFLNRLFFGKRKGLADQAGKPEGKTHQSAVADI